jgi:hypothetical protein
MGNSALLVALGTLVVVRARLAMVAATRFNGCFTTIAIEGSEPAIDPQGVKVELVVSAW